MSSEHGQSRLLGLFGHHIGLLRRRLWLARRAECSQESPDGVWRADTVGKLQGARCTLYRSDGRVEVTGKVVRVFGPDDDKNDEVMRVDDAGYSPGPSARTNAFSPLINVDITHLLYIELPLGGA